MVPIMVHRMGSESRNLRNDLFINAKSCGMICTEVKSTVVQFCLHLRSLGVEASEKGFRATHAKDDRQFL